MRGTVSRTCVGVMRCVNAPGGAVGIHGSGADVGAGGGNDPLRDNCARGGGGGGGDERGGGGGGDERGGGGGGAGVLRDGSGGIGGARG